MSSQSNSLTAAEMPRSQPTCSGGKIQEGTNVSLVSSQAHSQAETTVKNANQQTTQTKPQKLNEQLDSLPLPPTEQKPTDWEIKARQMIEESRMIKERIEMEQKLKAAEEETLDKARALAEAQHKQKMLIMEEQDRDIALQIAVKEAEEKNKLEASRDIQADKLFTVVTPITKQEVIVVSSTPTEIIFVEKPQPEEDEGKQAEVVFEEREVPPDEEIIFTEVPVPDEHSLCGLRSSEVDALIEQARVVAAKHKTQVAGTRPKKVQEQGIVAQCSDIIAKCIPKLNSPSNGGSNRIASTPQNPTSEEKNKKLDQMLLAQKQPSATPVPSKETDWTTVTRSTYKRWATIDSGSKYLQSIITCLHSETAADNYHQTVATKSTEYNALYNKLYQDAKKNVPKRQSRAQFFQAQQNAQARGSHKNDTVSQLDLIVEWISSSAKEIDFKEFASIVSSVGENIPTKIQGAILERVPESSKKVAQHIMNNRRVSVPPEIIHDEKFPVELVEILESPYQRPPPFLENIRAFARRLKTSITHTFSLAQLQRLRATGSHGEVTETDDVDYVDSDVFFQDSFSVPPGSTTAEFLFTNTTGNTVIWKEYSASVVLIVVAIPTIGAFLTTALQTTAPGSLPLSLAWLGSKHNTSSNRLIAPSRTGLSVGTFGLGIVTLNFTRTQAVVVPPGHTLWFTMYVPVTPSLTLNCDMIVNLYNGNFRIFPSDMTDTISVFLNTAEGTKTISGPKAKVLHRVAGLVDENTFVVSGTRLWDVSDGVENGAVYRILGRTRGGSSGMPPSIPKLGDTPPVANEAKPTIKSGSNTYIPKLTTIMNKVRNGDFDNFFGTTNMSIEALINSYALSALKTDAFDFNSVGEQIMHNFPEMFLSGQFMRTNTDAPVLVESATCIVPAAPGENVMFSLSGPFANMNAYIQTNDVIGLSQYIRIDQSMANGDSMARILASHGQKFKAGIVGSFAAPLLRCLSYIYSLSPILGIENASVSNMHLTLGDPNPVIDITEPFVFLQETPTSIPARMIDVNTMTAILAGTSTTVIPPAEWGPSTWGSDTALIPISFDASNQPENATAWATMFMESTFANITYNFVAADDYGNIYGSFPQVSPKANRTRVPGPYKRLLFVLVNAFASGMNQLQYMFGSAAAPVALNLATNGLQAGGVSVDLLPALNTFFTLDPATIQFSYYQCYRWWLKFFGNEYDHSMAFLAASDHFHLLSFPATMSFEDGTLRNTIICLRTGGTDPDWNTDGFTQQPGSALTDNVLSCTTPSGVVTSDLTTIMQLTGPYTSIPTYDPVAGVCAVWGVFSMKDPILAPAPHIPAIISRIRWNARCLSPIFDFAIQATGFGVNDLYAQNMMTDGFGRAQALSALKGVYSFYKNNLQPTLGTGSITFKPETQMSAGIPLFTRGLYPAPMTTIYPFIRVPLPSVAAFVEIVLPQTFRMKKLPCTASIHRSNTALMGEYTDFKIKDPQGTDAQAWHTIVDAVYVTGSTAADPRFNPRMFMTNKTFAVATDIAYPVFSPSLSISMFIQYQDFAIPALGNILHPLKDIPSLAPLPRWFTPINMEVTLAIASDSVLFGQITRVEKAWYKKRLRASADAYGTALYGDTTTPPNPDELGGLLGF
jgi:hypothetical protein